MKKMLNTLYVTTPNCYLSLDGQNIVLKDDGEELGRVPLHNIQSIVSFGYKGVSPALMGACAEKNIRLAFCTMNGKFLAESVGTINGNVILRREQYRIADDAIRSLIIARNFITGKIFNAKWVIERACRDYPMRIDIEKLKSKSQFLSQSITAARNAKSLDILRGVEGEAASVYYSIFDDLILRQKDDFKFGRRNKRPPMDKVNAMLSFAYSLLAGMCASALQTVGLDPYVGFMHTDRPGRKSLALDIMEELRSVFADRFVLTMINKQIISGADFIRRENNAILMTDEGRKTFLKQWQLRKQTEIMHPFIKEKIEWGLVPYVQAMLLSRHIRNDIDGYPPFMWK